MEIMFQLVFNFIIGMLPDILFFTFFIIYTKGITNKKLKLGICIAISYTILITIVRFKVLFYLLFIFSIYLILKLLYREQTELTDVFMFSVATFYISLIYYLCFLVINNDLSRYYLVCFIARILLLVPFIYRKSFKDIYIKYKNYWKTKKEISDIITLSVVFFNILIFSLNIVINLISS